MPDSIVNTSSTPLTGLQNILGGMVRSTWATEVNSWGELVSLYRNYADGEHRAKLTSEMRKMLRISDASTDQFNMNYCDMIVQTMVDRLKVSAIEGENDPANQWSADVLTFNRFDGLQADVASASLTDGVTYLLVGFDNEAQMPTFSLEPAWDGDSGMIAIWDRTLKTIIAAAKIWWERDDRRMNVYTDRRVTKYVEKDGKIELLKNAESWLDRSGTPIGVPVVAFRNRARPRQTTGMSEIAGIIPLQDALNRTLVSMVMTAELSAFMIRYLFGVKIASGALTPGMFLQTSEVIDKDDQIVVGSFEQAQLVPFISQAEFLIDQIGTISRTPLPRQMGGDTQSGEALKQRETGLLGKVERAQVKFGNAWEDVMTLASKVQAAFGLQNPPLTSRWNCKWEDAQLRTDTEVIDNAIKVKDLVGEEETLRLIAPVYNYDEAKIKQLIQDKQSELSRRLLSLPLPDFTDNPGNGDPSNGSNAPGDGGNPGGQGT